MGGEPAKSSAFELLKVGELYHPGVRSWAEAADYDLRAGGHELRLFLPGASALEIEAAQSGPMTFGLLVDGPLIFFIVRFDEPGSAGRLVMSFDASYSWWRVSPDERTMPAVVEGCSPELRALLTVVLVEARDGIVKALRVVSFSPEFTRVLHRAIGDQAGRPYDPAEEHRVGNRLLRLSPGQLWDRCRVHCRGGD
jgi:hypothetical protein